MKFDWNALLFQVGQSSLVVLGSYICVCGIIANIAYVIPTMTAIAKKQRRKRRK